MPLKIKEDLDQSTGNAMEDIVAADTERSRSLVCNAAIKVNNKITSMMMNCPSCCGNKLWRNK